MTKMTTIPENYNNIRAEIVEMLNAARSFSGNGHRGVCRRRN